LNKFLPVILFVICIAIAVILAVTLPSLWPAALAIAISGAALALALRVYGSNESDDLLAEIAELRQENADLRAEVEKSNAMTDELADVVEQIAAISAGDSDRIQPQIDGLQAEIQTLQSLPAPVALPDPRLDSVDARLATIESELSQRIESHDGTLNLVETVPPSPPTPSDTPTVGADKLRSLIARASGATAVEEPETVNAEDDTALKVSNASDLGVTLAPVFEPGLGAPVAFILSVQGAETEDTVSVLLGHAVQISTELEEAGREVLLLVRLSSQILSNLVVRNEILTAIDGTPALQRRLTLLTQQDGFDATVHNTLAAIANHGCKFALEQVRDWSLDLAALSKSGMRFILVDALAMANSARAQGGDPRRLAQALAVHDIALIGGSVANKDDMETVRTLEPALVTGDGLGSVRVLDPAA